MEYLLEHEDAQDTIDGIARWWLLVHRMEIALAGIQTALDDLVSRGLVLARQSSDGKVHYSLGPENKRTWRGRRRPTLHATAPKPAHHD
jgi:hypothetical protein